MIKNLLFKKPVIVVFDVTKRCNSRCNMCSIWKKPSKLRNELKLNEIKKIFNDLKSYGIKHVFLQGGEPLLRKDILDIIKLSINIGLTPSLVTNGLLLSEKLMFKLSKLKCNVSISLDTLNKKRYKLIRGINKLDLVLKNIKIASKIKNKKGRWQINSTISKINYDEVIELFNFAKKNGLEYSAFPYNYSICNVSAKNSKLIFDKEINKIIKAFKMLSSIYKTEGLIDYILYDEIIKFLKGNYKKPCDAMKHSIMINEKGELAPCLELKPFISLKDYELKEAIKKFDYSIVKKCYLNTPCFYGCTRVTGSFKNNFYKLFLFVLRHPKKVKKYLTKNYL